MQKRTILSLFALTAFLIPHALFAAAPVITSPDVLLFTNAQRYRAGLPNLTVNAQLSQVAYTKMRDLFSRQYFAHEAPTGEDVADLARSIGYSYIAVGENLALGDFVSNKHVVDAWMDSPGHRANMLSKKYSEIGIAAGHGLYKGKIAWIVVQSFGLPKSACPILDATVRAEITALDNRLAFLMRLLEARRASAEESGISRAEYNKRAEYYNLVVVMYNSVVRKQKRLVEEYNAEVDSFNDCLDAKLADTTLPTR